MFLLISLLLVFWVDFIFNFPARIDNVSFIHKSNFWNTNILIKIESKFCNKTITIQISAQLMFLFSYIWEVKSKSHNEVE